MDQNEAAAPGKIQPKHSDDSKEVKRKTDDQTLYSEWMDDVDLTDPDYYVKRMRENTRWLEDEEKERS